jgi:hypothetical protein
MFGLLSRGVASKAESLATLALRLRLEAKR